jgi:AraC family transcriptional activator of pobA
MMHPLIKIPVNKQTATAVGGVEILHIKASGQDFQSLHAHRDEYFVLTVIIKGSGVMQCDMETIPVRPRSVIFMKPYQVHAAELSEGNGEAYFISIAPFLIPEFCRNIFDNVYESEQFKRLSSTDLKELLKMVELLHHAFNTDNIYKAQITINLLNALVIHVASLFSSSEQRLDQKQSQSFKLSQRFRSLVSEHSFLHTASFFAEKLNVASSHLNDCVKATIGISVTGFLQQTMLLEAKRQLYYTNADVKAIAFNLGFEDHTYFSRLFKKLSYETPLAFRSRFRE